MTVIEKGRVVCPTCDGTGAGSGFGISGGGGMCADCRGSGEVTPTKRERLLRRGVDGD